MSVRDAVVGGFKMLLPKGEATRKMRFGLASGTRMRIDFDTNLALYFGQYESELHPAIQRLVRPNDRCFDIGGHIGYDAIIFAKLSQGPVVSVESTAENIAKMQANFALNPALKIEAVRGFVAADADAVQGHVSIDSLARQHFQPTFIKLDIEGGEADALLGAPEVIAKQRPRFLIETHGLDIENRCIETLKAARYGIEIVNPRGGIREQRGDIHNRWIICEPA